SGTKSTAWLVIRSFPAAARIIGVCSLALGRRTRIGLRRRSRLDGTSKARDDLVRVELRADRRVEVGRHGGEALRTPASEVEAGELEPEAAADILRRQRLRIVFAVAEIKELRPGRLVHRRRRAVEPAVEPAERVGAARDEGRGRVAEELQGTAPIAQRA